MEDFNINIENKLKTLFKEWSGLSPDKITQLPHSGSSRIYFRLENNSISAIGAYNSNLNENIAFIDFTKQFLKHRINVPQILSENLNENVYLISAQELERKGKKASAVKFYEKLIKMNLEDVEKLEIKHKLLDTYNALGKFREARLLEGI